MGPPRTDEFSTTIGGANGQPPRTGWSGCAQMSFSGLRTNLSKCTPTKAGGGGGEIRTNPANTCLHRAGPWTDAPNILQDSSKHTPPNYRPLDKRPEHTPNLLQDCSWEHLLNNVRAPLAELGQSSGRSLTTLPQSGPHLNNVGASVARIGHCFADFGDRSTKTTYSTNASNIVLCFPPATTDLPKNATLPYT